MKIYPAMDLMNGACVRLRQGAFEAKTVYGEYPVYVLAKFQEAGAEFVHIVDLDGAKDPNQRQTRLIKKLAESSTLKIQAGGGIRSMEDVEELLSAGVQRVVVGTLAVEDPTLVYKMFERFGGDRLTLAVDLFAPADGDVTIVTRGWREKSHIRFGALMETFLQMGLKRVLCTDVSKDGMLAGPNLDLYRWIADAFPDAELQASGGVRSIDDLLALKQVPVHSAIVGKALYEKGLDLAEAVRRC